VSFLVDTDICSAYLKGNNRVHGHFVQYGGRVHISAITAGQLFTWALIASPPSGRVQRLLQLLRDTTFLDVNRSVSEKFGDLRTQQIKLGQKTPPQWTFPTGSRPPQECTGPTKDRRIDESVFPS
jgi:predicted nucleic acid-binding protein